MTARKSPGGRSSARRRPKGRRRSAPVFEGFRRPAGGPGARNHLVVISAMDNTNPLVRRIGNLVRDAVTVNTTFGRGLMGEDERQHLRVMGHMAGHPNVGAAIVVSLEPKSAEAIAEVAAKAAPWLPLETVSLHQTGGTLKTAARAMELAAKLSSHLARAKRERCELGEITLGTECGGSDTTSGLVSNPAVGMAADRLADLGGTVIFSETLEIVGAEDALARRAADPLTRRRILEAVQRALDYAASLGVDVLGINPTADNMRGGLSSIEEKSLGAVKKGGSRPIVEVVGVGERPRKRGTVFADAPCGGVENITSLAASGAHAILFSTGIGNPIGHPISPTIKVTGNPRTAARMAENIDIDLSAVLEGRMSFDEAAAVIEEELLAVLSGKLTSSELLGETEVTVSRAALSL